MSTWQPAAGALYYEVVSLGNRSPYDFHNCSTSETNCTMQGIPCGQHLTTTLTAFDDECASRTLLDTVSETGEKNFPVFRLSFSCASQ